MIKSKLFEYKKENLLETIVFGYGFISMKIYSGVYIGYNSDTEQYILQGAGLRVFCVDIITESKEALLGEVVAKTIEDFEKKVSEDNPYVATIKNISADKIL